jgi:hypothetical protein
VGLIREKVMDYVPEDLVIVSCKNGHEQQMHSDTEVEEVICFFCGEKVFKVEND